MAELVDVAVRAGQGWGASVMNDSSSALRQPTLPSRLQTFTAGQLTSDRRGNKTLHADVVLPRPNAKALDQ